METNYINPNLEVDDHTHLSGAYIRNLVKQLATSSSSSSSPSSSASPPSTPPKTHQKSQSNTPHKKQVRRRLHTTKPYQERLLNMAEARKEIVTALKFHRATMKQQQQQSHQPPTPPPLPPQQTPQFQETNFYSSTTPPLVLPNQTLGLNLSSFQDLTNLDAACLYTAAGVDEVTSPLSPPSVSSILPDSVLTSPDPAPAVDSGEADRRQGVGPRALGELEMEEIKYIGEMHEMEWNDTLNLANSAWWFKFLNNMEVEQDLDNSSPTYVCNDRQFEQAVELPFMNIEDIEGQDEEWLS
ncbi:hypothetical protein V2J09_008068 [Rumex salicifolius]